jgi:hypothetical protein
MEPKFNTSFIPKESLETKTTRTPPQKRAKSNPAYGIGFGITMVMAVVAIAVTVGIFLYAHVVKTGIAEKQAQLVESYATLDENIILDLRTLDARLRGAEQIIENHVAMSHFFTLLEQYTLRRGLRYTSMNFSYEAGENPTVGLSGEAEVLSNVALQMDAFHDSGAFETVVLRGVQRGGEELATFSISLTLPEEKVLFMAQGGSAPGTVPILPVSIESDVATEPVILIDEDISVVVDEVPAEIETEEEIENQAGDMLESTEEIPGPVSPPVPPVVSGDAPDVPLIPLQ